MNNKRTVEDAAAATTAFSLQKRQRTCHNAENLNRRPQDRYTIAWICALYIEMAAAKAMLDVIHDNDIPREGHDGNTYILGSIGSHNIAMACLPDAQYGNNNAASVITDMRRTFPSIRVGLMVGIGGGAPGRADIRLGDIVVGTRVMQYDMGKIGLGGELERTAIPRYPDYALCTAVSNIRCQHELSPSRVPSILEEKMAMHPSYNHPDAPDRLFQPSYKHENAAADCCKCDQHRLQERPARVSDVPVIHYGAIGSSNQVMKDATTRDKVCSDLGVICFEMEAAGLMNVLPCLPIRGICDYADSHKSKEWQRYAAATAAAFSRELLEVLPSREIATNQSQVTNNETEDVDIDRRQQLLKSLGFDRIDARMTGIKASYSKTCDWFLDHPDYLAWLDPTQHHNGFLWIRGKPGSGKSTLMKFLYLKMKKIRGSGRLLTASFFFNARGDSLEKTVPGMYRSLLLQIFRAFPDLQTILNDPDLVPLSQTGCPPLNVLKDLLRTAVCLLGTRSLMCFIDALDECDEQQVIDMVGYFEELADLAKENNVHLQICFSSRHYPYLTVKKGIEITLEHQAGHANDLESYIESNLRINDTELVNDLRDTMLSKAAGVFLWVVLVVDILNKENGRGRLAMRKKLEEIPSRLSELFKDLLRRDGENMEELLLSILWILLARGPSLSPEQYYHALWSGLRLKNLADADVPSTLSSDFPATAKGCVVSSSKGLAEISQHRVQFIHESVRDFLVKDNGLYDLWPDLGSDWESMGHDRLKECCKFYLDESDTVDPSKPSRKWLLKKYACENILSHANLAAKSISQRQFLDHFPLSRWIKHANRYEMHKVRRFTPDADLLYILSERALPALIRTKLEQDPEIRRSTEERYVHPFFAAIASGNKDAVAAILSLPSTLIDGIDFAEGLMIGKQIPDCNLSPLSWAVEHGNLTLIKILLQNGADVNECTHVGWTALHRAARRADSTAINLLLEAGASVNATGHDGSTPLHMAAELANSTAINLLLKAGASVDVADSSGWTALHKAAYYANSTAINLLLEAGASVNTADSHGQTALHKAAFCANSTAINLLLKAGASVNTADSSGQTALHKAAFCADSTAINLLLEAGASVNTADSRGRTALHEAALRADSTAINLLLEAGASMNTADSHGQTALHKAAHANSTAIKLLLEAGASVNVADYDGWTALHDAVSRGALLIAELLLDEGAAIDIPAHSGITPLDLSKKVGRDMFKNLLLEKGTKLLSGDNVN